jgi:hypothetical protein
MEFEKKPTDVEEPTTLQTRFEPIIVDENQYRLSLLTTYDEIAAASHDMLHGEIVSMLNFLEAQGYCRPPTYLFGLFYKHGKPGKCFICNGPQSQNWKGPIEVRGGFRGNKIRITRSGYCDRCALNVHRYSLWKAVEQQRWLEIKAHPIPARPMPVRWVRATLSLAPYYGHIFDQKFFDPYHPGQRYTRRDRNRPSDTLDETVIDHALNSLAITQAQLLQLKRAKRRF